MKYNFSSSHYKNAILKTEWLLWKYVQYQLLQCASWKTSYIIYNDIIAQMTTVLKYCLGYQASMRFLLKCTAAGCLPLTCCPLYHTQPIVTKFKIYVHMILWDCESFVNAQLLPKTTVDILQKPNPARFNIWSVSISDLSKMLMRYSTNY